MARGFTGQRISEMNSANKHERRAMSAWDAKMEPRSRAHTAHADAVRCAERGWTWMGKKYACRDDWESDVLRYHGAMTM